MLCSARSVVGNAVEYINIDPLFKRSLYLLIFSFFFFKQKTADEMRISDWSSDVCSSDLRLRPARRTGAARYRRARQRRPDQAFGARLCPPRHQRPGSRFRRRAFPQHPRKTADARHRYDEGADPGGPRAALYLRRGADRSRRAHRPPRPLRSEEHTSELQSLMRISYAVFCLKKKQQKKH